MDGSGHYYQCWRVSKPLRLRQPRSGALTHWIVLGSVAFAGLVETSWGQKASNWRVYRLADGLPESACMSVTIAPQGKVLAKHFTEPSVSELDGYSISVMPSAEGANSRVYESPGGQLWTVMAEGLQEFRDGAWMLHPVPEIAAEFRSGLARVIDPVPLFPVRQGVVLVLLPQRLIRFNAENPESARSELLRLANQTQLERFSAMTVARDGGLWIGGRRGLAKAVGPVRNLKLESEWQEFIPPASLAIESLQEVYEDADGSITALADSSKTHQKMIVHFDRQHWSAHTAGLERIRHGWYGPDKTCWAATIDSLFQWDETREEMIENEDISARQYFDLAIEPGGNFWLATSEGLFRFTPQLWRNPFRTNKVSSLVHGLASDKEGRMWFISGSELHLAQDDRHEQFAFPPATFHLPQAVHALYPLKDGTLLLDAGEQALRFQPGNGRWTQLNNQAERFKALGLLKDASLCVQSFGANGAASSSRLKTYDGKRFETLTDLPSDPDVGPNLSACFSAQNGDLWISGERGTAVQREKKWRTFLSNDKSTPEAVVAFAELPDAKIWAATADKIWEFDGRNWSAVRRGFDRINGIVRAGDSVWVASNGGLHRFFQSQSAWVENGLEEGLPSTDVRELYEDQRGRLWAGTTRGLSLYHPETDPDPPRTFIQAPQEKNIREGDSITLTFSALDKWKYTPRERLLFSYRLDEKEWSTFSDANNVSFNDLSGGKHYFQVRAMDRNCNIDPKAAQMDFAVLVPWFREKRLLTILFAGVAAALFFAGLAFNRHRQLVRSYADVEQKIAQRTQELEMANRELLHSQKMNALGTLAAGIAHDFNNILSIVKGSAQIIEDNLEDPQKVRTRVDRIKTVVEQGAGIVKAMLGFSRDSDQQADPCDLNLVVQETLKLLGDRFLREVEVRFEPAGELPQVQCARDFIQQILLNFIFNAADAMDKRKEIILRTCKMDNLPAGLVLAPGKAGAYVAVSVLDIGCGIPAENMARIFEPFFTTKALSARRGTGLGLSMVYELARKMEAGLAVESVVDQGSAFTLILPVREAKTKSE